MGTLFLAINDNFINKFFRFTVKLDGIMVFYAFDTLDEIFDFASRATEGEIKSLYFRADTRKDIAVIVVVHFIEKKKKERKKNTHDLIDLTVSRSQKSK